ncbi:MAG TPA: prepilin-type N-terminal cleavage/methylation domain-containing protein [Planctomycetota bacterium]|nr:prepilin-type N-terminal cleavage/methylation domain-containing protein [Planctomycetota bacterium]
MRRGFSLIEVLAALLLVAIVLPVVMQAFDVTTSMATLARQRTEAAALADSQINELVGTGDWKLGVLSGDFADQGHPEYTWRAELVNWDTSTLEELDVHVIWEFHGKEHDYTVSTLVDQAQ